jgi:hypothetical protein
MEKMNRKEKLEFARINLRTACKRLQDTRLKCEKIVLSFHKTLDPVFEQTKTELNLALFEIDRAKEFLK